MLDITAPKGAPKDVVTISVGGLLIKSIKSFSFEEEMKTVHQSYNIGKQMVDWVIYNDVTDVSVKHFGLQSTKDWFISALENWTVRIKERCPLQYHFTIDTWQGTSNGRDLEEQKTSLKNHFENNKFKMIYMTTFNIAFLIVFFIALIVLVTAIIKQSLVAIIVGAVLLLGSAAAIALGIMSNQKKYIARVNAAEHNLEGCMAQIIEFQRYFSENIYKKDDVLARHSYV